MESFIAERNECYFIFIVGIHIALVGFMESVLSFQQFFAILFRDAHALCI